MSKEPVIETALRRHEIIAPLLVPGLDEAEKRRIRRGGKEHNTYPLPMSLWNSMAEN